jgi:hypothetical protein
VTNWALVRAGWALGRSSAQNLFQQATNNKPGEPKSILHTNRCHVYNSHISLTLDSLWITRSSMAKILGGVIMLLSCLSSHLIFADTFLLKHLSCGSATLSSSFLRCITLESRVPHPSEIYPKFIFSIASCSICEE